METYICMYHAEKMLSERHRASKSEQLEELRV